tara:strand:+ start:1074 stop:1670 length:597 start_codon:yes stop_codon:yes gene_type:complete
MSKDELKKEDIKPAKDFGEKEVKPIHQEDLLRAVRFTIKASTCLNDIDALSESKKYFKFAFKGACKKWASFIESHTSIMMKEYAKHDDKALNEVYTAFETALDKIEYKTTERTALMKLYLKLKSIMFDVSSIEKHKEDYYNLFMYVNTKAFISLIEKQYGDLKYTEDKKGRKPMEIILFLNNLGNEILASDESSGTNT